MIKEQVAEMLYADGDSLPVDGWQYLNPISKGIYRVKAQQILNLFKAEVDKLTVIDDEEIERIVEHAFDEELWIDHKPTQWELELYVYKKVLKSNLQDIKKELLDLMGE